MNVLNDEFSGFAEMVLIHLPFVVVDVVGEGDMPACIFEADSHKANPGEELRNGLFLFVHFYLRALLHRLRAALKLEAIKFNSVALLRLKPTAASREPDL